MLQMKQAILSIQEDLPNNSQCIKMKISFSFQGPQVVTKLD